MLETREIECFLAVANALHFGRAAEQLHLSTTRVSQTIRGLERRVGAPLFERTSRVVRLTPLGERLLGGLLPAYQQLDQVWREAQQAAASTTLTVGLSASVPTSIQPTIVDAFEAEQRGSHLIVVPVNPLDMFLWDERVGIGLDAIIGWLPPGTGRRVTPFLSAGAAIRRSAPALLMSKDHRFARRDSVDIEELADAQVLLAPGVDRLLTPWIPATTPSGRPIHLVRREVRYIERLTAEVTKDEVVHLTILEFGLLLPMAGTVVVPLTGRAPFECRLIWPTNRETPAIRTLARIAARTGAEAGWLSPSRC